MEALLAVTGFSYGPGIIGWIIIGGIAGAIAGRIVQGGGFGILGDIVVGIVGAFIGGLILSFFNTSANGWLSTLITALIGAIILLFAVRAFTGGGNRSRI